MMEQHKHSHSEHERKKKVRYEPQKIQPNTLPALCSLSGMTGLRLEVCILDSDIYFMNAVRDSRFKMVRPPFSFVEQQQNTRCFVGGRLALAACFRCY